MQRSADPEEYRRAAREEAAVDTWLELTSAFLTCASGSLTTRPFPWRCGGAPARRRREGPVDGAAEAVLGAGAPRGLNPRRGSEGHTIEGMEVDSSACRGPLDALAAEVVRRNPRRLLGARRRPAAGGDLDIARRYGESSAMSSQDTKSARLPRIAERCRDGESGRRAIPSTRLRSTSSVDAPAKRGSRQPRRGRRCDATGSTEPLVCLVEDLASL